MVNTTSTVSFDGENSWEFATPQGTLSGEYHLSREYPYKIFPLNFTEADVQLISSISVENEKLNLFFYSYKNNTASLDNNLKASLSQVLNENSPHLNQLADLVTRTIYNIANQDQGDYIIHLSSYLSASNFTIGVRWHTDDCVEKDINSTYECKEGRYGISFMLKGGPIIFSNILLSARNESYSHSIEALNEVGKYSITSVSSGYGVAFRIGPYGAIHRVPATYGERIFINMFRLDCIQPNILCSPEKDRIGLNLDDL